MEPISEDLPRGAPSTRPRIGRRAVQGAGAGAAATAVMSGVMLGARRAGLTGKLPPEKITERALDALRIRRSESAENASATAAHLGYGMLSGAIFAGLVRGRLLRNHPIAEGIAFGGLVWLASYFGWVPALGIMPRPTRDRPDRSIVMAAAHAVFGAVLGALTRSIRTRRAVEAT